MTELEIIIKQEESMGVLWRAFDFNKAKLAKASGFSRNTVQGWFNRGRVSAKAAVILEQLEEVKKFNLKKEDMRPDVKRWYRV